MRQTKSKDLHFSTVILSESPLGDESKSLA
jgi:hypothetical protein